MTHYLTSINDVRWPECGGNVIFEHINSESHVHTTAPWVFASDNHSINGAVSPVFDVTQRYTHSIESNPDAIKWLVDGIQFHGMNIAFGISSTHEFHMPQYIFINLPIEGNWPDVPNAITILPDNLFCDYVKAYEWVPEVFQTVSSLGGSPDEHPLPKNENLQLATSLIPYNKVMKRITLSRLGVSLIKFNW